MLDLFKYTYHPRLFDCNTDLHQNDDNFKQQNFKKPHKPISIELDCDIYNQNHMDNFNFD